MNVGIIAEFNPLHNGHLHLIRSAKEMFPGCTLIIALSGNFCQRGEPAVCDKYTRAGWVLDSGADLVLEIPPASVLQSADYFASGGVRTLHLAGCENLIFGSESGDIGLLLELSRQLEKESLEISSEVKKNLSAGCSYPTAMAQAHDRNHDVLKPNNILGACYLTAIRKFAPEMKPFTIPRKGCGYYSEESSSGITSATALRKMLSTPEKTSAFVPPDVYHSLSGFNDWRTAFYLIFRYRMLYDPPDLAEGLQNHWKNHLNCNSLDQFLKSIATRRYTVSRNMRSMCRMLLGISDRTLSGFNRSGFRFLRVLGFSEKGRSLLSLIKKHTVLIQNRSQIFRLSANSRLFRILKHELMSDGIYSLLFPQSEASLKSGKPQYRRTS